MLKSKTDIEHYVPRTYLRSFAYKRDTCYVYDKKQQKYYQSNVNNIMGERYFYDIPEELAKSYKQNGFGQDVDTQMLEKLLGATVDSYLSVILNNIDQNYEEWFSPLRFSHYLDVYRCIAIQLLRTPKGKATILKAYKVILNNSIDDKNENVLAAKWISEILTEPPNSYLLYYLLNNYGHICVGLNESEIPFITGDNPVLNIGKYDGDKEDVVYYPITPTRCVFLRNRKHVESQLQMVLQDFRDGKFKIKEDIGEILIESNKREKALIHENNPVSEVIDVDKIVKLNTSIYLASTRFVVSNINLDDQHEQIFAKNLKDV